MMRKKWSVRKSIWREFRRPRFESWLDLNVSCVQMLADDSHQASTTDWFPLMTAGLKGCKYYIVK